MHYSQNVLLALATVFVIGQLAAAHDAILTPQLSGETVPFAGRIIVSDVAHNITLGTVCNDNFSLVDALVVCRSAGFVDSVAAVAFPAPGGTGPIAVDELSCPATATSLDGCTQAHGHDCTHAEDVGVYCVPPPGPTASDAFQVRLANGSASAPTTAADGSANGLAVVQVSTASSSGWGVVCPGGFDAKAAVVACRSLGFAVADESEVSFAARAAESAELRGVGAVTSRLECNGTEASLAECGQVPAPYAYCGANEAVALACGAQNVWEYRLNGNSAFSGRLEIKAPGATSWSAVCDDSFDYVDAIVACRSVGIDATHVYKFYPWDYIEGSEDFVKFPVLPYGMNDVECSGSENSLELCFFDSQTGSLCMDEDVALHCVDAASQAEDAKIEVAVAVDTGVVLAKMPGAASSWGTICNEFGFDQQTANIACRSAGYSVPEGENVLFNTRFRASPPYMPNTLYDVSCRDRPNQTDVSHLGQCFHSTFDWFESIFGGTCDLALVVNCTVFVEYNVSLQEHQVQAADGSIVAIPGNGVVEASQIRKTAANVVTSASSPRTVWMGLQNAFQQESPSRPFTQIPRLVCLELGYAPDDLFTANFYIADSVMNPASYAYNETLLLHGSCPVGADSLSCATFRGVHTLTGTGLDKLTGARPAAVRCGTLSAAANWEFRLATDNHPNMGLLELRPNSSMPWGVVGSFVATPESRVLNTMCRSVGFASGDHSFFKYQKSTDRTVYLRDPSCMGGEKNLALCEFVPFPPSTNINSFVGIRCGPSTTNTSWEYRLSDPPRGAASGRIEYRENASSLYQSIQRFGFTPTADAGAWTTLHTSCRSLGYSAFVRGELLDTVPGPFSLPISERQIQCAGELQLRDCPYVNAWYPIHDFDATISCVEQPKDQLEGYPEPWSNRPDFQHGFGLAEVVLYPGAPSLVRGGPPVTGVCTRYRNITKDVARLFCPSLPASVEPKILYGGQQAPLNFDQAIYNLECPDGVTSLGQCTFQGPDFPDCGPEDFLYVNCHDDDSGQLPRPGWNDVKIEFRINDLGGPLNNLSGRLEIKPNATAGWGTVCNNGFENDNHAALAACRSAGLADATAGYAFNSNSTDNLTSTMPIFADDFRCNSGAPLLTHCSFSQSPTCSHANDVGVHCVVPPSDRPELHITANSDGLVKVGLASDPGQEGTLCADGQLGQALAVAVCRGLGYTNGDELYLATAFPYLVESSANLQQLPIFASGIRCDDATTDNSSSAILSCAMTPKPFATCPSNLRVGVRCGPEAPTPMLVRREPSYEPPTTTKPIQVKPTMNSSWGYVCSDGSAEAALAMCRSLGFLGDSVVAVSTSVPLASVDDHNPVVHGSLLCPSGFSDLNDCTFGSIGDVCASGGVLAVGCVDNSQAPNALPTFRALAGSGILEVNLLSGGNLWGMFCSDGFGNREADVACRTLGFQQATDYGNAGNCPAINRTARFANPRFSCPVGATSLNQCEILYSFDGTSPDDCGCAFVKCSNAPPSYGWMPGFGPSTGEVGVIDETSGTQIRFTSTIDDLPNLKALQSFASAACRSAGFGEASIAVPDAKINVKCCNIAGISCCSSDFTPAYDVSQCSPHGTLRDCHFEYGSLKKTLQYRYYTTVNCTAANSGRVEWETDIQPLNTLDRLTGRGLLRVRPVTPGNNAAFGVAYYGAITASIATNACQRQGWNSGTVVPRFVGASGPMYITQLDCPYTVVQNQDLSNCTFSSNGTYSESLAAGVLCSMAPPLTNPPQPTDTTNVVPVPTGTVPPTPAQTTTSSPAQPTGSPPPMTGSPGTTSPVTTGSPGSSSPPLTHVPVPTTTTTPAPSAGPSPPPSTTTDVVPPPHSTTPTPMTNPPTVTQAPMTQPPVPPSSTGNTPEPATVPPTSVAPLPTGTTPTPGSGRVTPAPGSNSYSAANQTSADDDDDKGTAIGIGITIAVILGIVAVVAAIIVIRKRRPRVSLARRDLDELPPSTIAGHRDFDARDAMRDQPPAPGDSSIGSSTVSRGGEYHVNDETVVTNDLTDFDSTSHAGVEDVNLEMEDLGDRREGHQEVAGQMSAADEAALRARIEKLAAMNPDHSLTRSVPME